MKSGAENRKKTIIAGALGVAALLCVFYIYNTLFGGPSTPPPTPAPVVAAAPAGSTNGTKVTTAAPSAPVIPAGGSAAGVAATKLVTMNSSLDPTLDESAMLRTESLVYSGTGRNIFSLVYTPPVVEVKAVAPARPVVAPPIVPSGPPPIPPPPPIPLKFFGTVKRGTAKAQAFVLDGEDVYLAAEGDIVARKFKIVSINANTIQVTDLQNNNTQTLPLQMN